MSGFEKILTAIARRAEIHTIRTKLIISFLLIALLPLTIMSLFSYKAYFGSLTQRIGEYSQEVVNRMARDLDEYFSDIETLLTREQDFYIDQFIKLNQGNDFNNRKYTFRIWEDFHNLRRVKPGLEEIALTFADGKRLSSYGLYLIDIDRFMDDIQDVFLPSGAAIIGPHTNFLNQTVVTMVRPYIPSSAETSIFISADINLERLASIANVKLGRKGFVFVADRDGRIVFHPEFSRIGQTSQFYQADLEYGFEGGGNRQDSQDFFLTTAYSPVTGWNVVSVAYADEIGAELAPIRNITLLVIGLIFLGVIFLAVYLSHSLSEPIKQLQELTQRAANNELSVHIETQGKDEIAQLGHSFNKMISRIQELMSENVKEQKLLRQLEMESLNNQIKPHFIYNTLDLIIGQLESNNTSQASYLIEALGNFFRLSLSQGREIVPIASEVEHVRNYLFIQQLRHGEEYQYEIEIKDPHILNHYIPRLLLQPLVENAIYHGILQADKKGKITITAYREGSDIYFEICDDGAGIEEEKLLHINEVLQGVRKLENEKEYFGLRNVNQRVKLMFGEDYGVQLTSELGQGTKAVLRIRAIEGDMSA